MVCCRRAGEKRRDICFHIIIGYYYNDNRGTIMLKIELLSQYDRSNFETCH